MSAKNLASRLYRSLNGIFCVYKPPDVSTKRLVESIKRALASDLNKKVLNSRQLNVIEKYQINPGVIPGLPAPTTSRVACSSLCESSVSKEDSNSISVPVLDTSIESIPGNDLVHHPSVLGELWQPDDWKILPSDALSYYTSGVLLCAIGAGAFRTLKTIQRSHPVRVYRVTALLGTATGNFLMGGRVIERCSTSHVTQAMIDRVLAGVQAVHQKHQYSLAKVDLQSERAYELATQGLIRPSHSQPTGQAVIYSIKCVDWSLPYLTLEIHVTNENGPALLNAIHNIGIELRCGATCYKLRRIRYGHFDTSHALVRQQWNSSCIIDNFSSCSAAVYRSTLDRMEQLTNDTYSTPLLKEDYSS